MAFTSFKNCTRKQYEDEIYGQDYQHKIKITFDGTELENAAKSGEIQIMKVADSTTYTPMTVTNN